MCLYPTNRRRGFSLGFLGVRATFFANAPGDLWEMCKGTMAYVRTSQAHFPQIPWEVFPVFTLETTFMVPFSICAKDVPGTARSIPLSFPQPTFNNISLCLNTMQGFARVYLGIPTRLLGMVCSGSRGDRGEELHGDERAAFFRG